MFSLNVKNHKVKLKHILEIIHFRYYHRNINKHNIATFSDDLYEYLEYCGVIYKIHVKQGISKYSFKDYRIYTFCLV